MAFFKECKDTIILLWMSALLLNFVLSLSRVQEFTPDSEAYYENLRYMADLFSIPLPDKKEFSNPKRLKEIKECAELLKQLAIIGQNVRFHKDAVQVMKYLRRIKVKGNFDRRTYKYLDWLIPEIQNTFHFNPDNNKPLSDWYDPFTYSKYDLKHLLKLAQKRGSEKVLFVDSSVNLKDIVLPRSCSDIGKETPIIPAYGEEYLLEKRFFSSIIDCLEDPDRLVLFVRG